MLLCVWCTGPKKFLLEISLCVCDVLAVLAQKSFCWEFLSVCVMYWPYKSFCWKFFCVCDVLAQRSFCWKFLSVCVMYWLYWPKKVFVGNFSVCVWCTGPIKVFVGNVSMSVCVLYWPYKSLCWKCFCVCDVLAL